MQLGNTNRIDAIRHAWSHQADLANQLQSIQGSPQQWDQFIDLLQVKTIGAIDPQGRPTTTQAATEQRLEPSQVICFLPVKRENSPQQPLASHLIPGLTDLNVNL